MEIKNDLSFVNFSQFGTSTEHNDDNEGKASVDARDIVVHNYNGCQYKVIVGATNYPISWLDDKDGKTYLPSDGNKGAFLFYIPVTPSSSCAVFSTEFGVDGHDTMANSVTQLKNGAMYVAGTTTGSLPGMINWSYPGNPAPFIAVKDQYSTTEKSWSPSEWVEFSSSIFQTLSTITSNPNDQNQRMYVSGVKQSKGGVPMYYAYLISHF
ncbi:MAG: hypothetical protein QG673_1124 [Pseudomonadota bacterium]|nr:hypothetical protein [Pseudomonadota bacterium]